MNIRYPKFLRQRRDHRKPRRHIRRKVRVEMLEARQLLAADPASWMLPIGEDHSARLEVTDDGDVIWATGYTDADLGVVVKKYSTLGMEQWTKTFLSSGGETVSDTAIDRTDPNSPFLYIRGSFNDQLDFGPAGILQSNGGWDDFVAKLDADGTPIWAKSFGGAGSEFLGGLTVHGASVYLDGAFSNNVAFGSTTLHATGSSSDGYVLKLDAVDGDVEWVKQITGQGSNAAEQITAHEATNGDVNLYVTGRLAGGSIELDSFTLQDNGRRHYLAKLDDNGADASFVWVEQFGGPTSQNLRHVTDADGQIFVAGNFTDTAYFGDETLYSPENSDGYVMRVTDNGTTANVDWVNQFGRTPNVAIDSGTLFVATSFSETENVFDSTDGQTTSLTPRGPRDGAIARYDVDGVLLEVQRFGGGDGGRSDQDSARNPVVYNGIAYMIARLESPDADTPAQTPSSAFPNAFPKTGVDRERLLLKLNSAAPIVKTMDPEILGSDGTPATLSATAVTGDLSTDLSGSIVWTDQSGATLGSGPSIDVAFGIGTHKVTASVADPVSGLIGMGGTVVTVADPNQPVVVFADSFEYGQWNGLWLEDSQNDWFTNSQRSTEGSSSAEVDGRATDATLSIATPIDMTAYANAELSFDWYIEGSVDSGEGLGLEFFDGLTWNQILSLDGNVDAENAWHSEVVQFDPQYLISDFQFRYSATMNRSNEDANVDNVQLIAAPTGPPNTAPVAVDDVGYSLDEDGLLDVVAAGVLANDCDDDDDTLTAVLVNGPTNGSLTLNSDGSFTYTPDADFNGSDSFTYQASDGSANSNTATVSITVNSVDDAPIAADDDYTTDQDTPITVSAPGVLNNDSDADGDGITVDSHTDSANGTVTVNSDGSFTYTPNPGYTGTDSFSYQASDGAELSNVAMVTVTVSAPSTAIHVADLDASTSLGSRGKWNAMVTITVHDADGNPIADATVTGSWSNGASGTATCTTDSNGQCTVSKNNLKKNVNSITFTITSLVHATHAYDPIENDDPDGDSDGTEITILKP